MTITGFCILKPSADFKHTMGKKELWLGKTIAAIEINDSTESVLLINDTNMGMFDFKDIQTKFKCIKKGIYLLPDGLNEIEQLMYMSYVQQRNGGYTHTVMKMIIAASLMKGEFTDSMLWSKNQDPLIVEEVMKLKRIAKKRTTVN